LKIYLYPVKINGLNLEFVPEVFRTPELCLRAVKSNPGAEDFVPKYLREKVSLKIEQSKETNFVKKAEKATDVKQSQRNNNRQPKRKGIRM
jgi:hypothetical protein